MAFIDFFLFKVRPSEFSVCMSLLIIIGLTVAIILICLFLVSVGIGLGDLNLAALNYLSPDPKVMFSDIL